MFVCTDTTKVKEEQTVDKPKKNSSSTEKSIKYFVDGVPLPVNGFMNYHGKNIPIIDVPLTADFKWQYNALIDRIQYPEKYRSSGENVDETIDKLLKWINKHSTEAAELSA